jgi:ACT domain-containing protein
MKVGLDIVLKDVPGQLVLALEPISKFGGNIISIVHEREAIKGGRVPIRVNVEVESTENLKRIIKEIEKRDIWVSKAGEIKKKEKITVLLTGHIVDTDLRDTIDRINEIKGVMVADVDLSMPHPDKESSARLDIEVSGRAKAKTALVKLDEIAREKKLFVIKSLEGMA